MKYFSAAFLLLSAIGGQIASGRVEVGTPEVKATVWVFVTADCPMALRYLDRIQKLIGTYHSSGVELKIILSEAEVDSKSAEAYRSLHRLACAVEPDPQGVLARKFGITVSPTAIVFDREFHEKYVGAIDDHRDPALVKSHYVQNALDALLAGHEPIVRGTPAFGCSLFWGPSAIRNSDVEYYKDIAPAIRSSCVKCHGSSGLAPFRLDSYEDMRRWAFMATTVLEQGSMPPWGTAPTAQSRFFTTVPAGLSGRIREWIEANYPEGENRDPGAETPGSNTWTLGTPTLVWKPGTIQSTQGESDIVRDYIYDPKISRDTFVNGFELLRQPNSPIRGVSVYVLDRGIETDTKEQDSTGGPSYPVRSWLGNWTPGMPAYRRKNSFGILLQPGDRLVIQLRYRAAQAEFADSPRLGFYTASPVMGRDITLERHSWTDFRIDGDDMLSDVRREFVISTETTISTVEPVMRYFGRSVVVTAILPSGVKRVLCNRPNWSFGWQACELLAPPVQLPAGTTIQIAAAYDASYRNPENPQKSERFANAGPNRTDAALILLLGTSKSYPLFDADYVIW